MTSPQAVKGATFERAVVAHLQACGHPYAERAAYGAGRPQDVGDIDGVPGFVIEVKNHNRLLLGPWLDEVECERVYGRQPYGLVIAKRRLRPVGDVFAVMTLDTFARMTSDEEVVA